MRPFAPCLLLAFATVGRAELPTYTQITSSGIDIAHFRARFANTYDADGNGELSVSEIGETFEYATTEQIDGYWKECDADRNARLDFEEWLPCAGAYSDNGERFIETSWDDLVQEGILNLD